MSKRPRGRPKGSGGAAAILDSAQIKRLFQCAQRMDGSSYRIQVALLLSHELGMRASEISKLRLGDIYNEQGNVHARVRAVSKRSNRVLPLRSVKLRVALADHFERSVRDRHLDQWEPLICSRRGMMTSASLSRLMTSVYRAAGIESGSSRSGRRTLRASLEEFGFKRS